MNILTARSGLLNGFGRPRELKYFHRLKGGFGSGISKRTSAVREYTGFKNLNSQRHYSQEISNDFAQLSKTRILSEEQEQLINREKTVLNKLLVALQRIGANETEIQTLKNGIKKLDELFLIVIVGEFNSGKSSFLNTKLGKEYLKEGITPTTSKINVIKYSSNESVVIDTENPDIEYIKLPVDWLREINVVDTPGTNAIISSHQKITEQFIPRSDLVLFITSVDRVLSESERVFLTKIEQWNKKVVFVVTKVDILTNPEAQIREVKEFIETNIPKIISLKSSDDLPPIFFISSKQQFYKQSLNQSNNSNKNNNVEIAANKERFEITNKYNQFDDLQKYILTTLDPLARTRLILENPIGVADHLIEIYCSLLKSKYEMLNADLQTLDEVQSNIDYFLRNMKKEYKYKQDRIEHSLLQLQRRFESFIDEKLKLTNILYLIQESKLRMEFEKQVIGDTNIEIDRELNNLVDWLIEQNAKEYQSLVDYMNARSNCNLQLTSNPMFETRQHILSNINFHVNDLIKTIEREDEAKRLTSLVQSTLLQAATGVGLSLSAIAFFSLFLFDVTGIVGASIASICGLFVVPYKRSRIKKSFHKKIDELKSSIGSNLAYQFDKEISKSSDKILQILSPLSHYVNKEKPKLDQLTEELKVIKSDLSGLKESIQQLWKK